MKLNTMRINPKWLMALGMCAVLLYAENRASATCLEVSRPYSGDIGFWVNSCSYGVTVQWTTSKGHSGLTWVKGHSRTTATVGPDVGRIEWRECESPTPYAQTPVRRSSGWVCE